MKPTFLFLFLFLFLSFTYFIQAQINPKTKWGNVSQAEIDYKEVAFEKEAGAVILYEEGKTTISGTFNNYIYRRIKILNEKGIEYANQEIVYYSYKNLERIGSIKAQTINIENGETKTYPIAKNEFYDTNLNEYYNTLKFTFPNVKVGSIIEFEYNMQDDKLYMIDAWRFQHDLPTIYSRFKISNESTLDYTSLMIGDKIVNYSKQKDKNQLDEWALSNLPSFKTLSFLYNPQDMSERIVFQLRGYMTSSGGSYGGGSSTYKDAIRKWKDLSKEMEDEYRAKSNDSYVKSLVSAIPNGKDDKETLQNVYDYFKSNYKWNRFTATQPRLSNRDLDKDKSGNVADLNLMLNTMLKQKGINSEMVLLSSRSHGKIVTSFPYLGQFNLAVNLVSLSDGSTYLIDASDLNNDLGFMPLRNYNHHGWVIDSKSDRFVNIIQPLSEYQSTQTYNLKDGKFQLSRVDKVNGYFKEKNKDLVNGIENFNPIRNSLDLLMDEKKKDSKIDESNYELTKTTYESNELGNGSFIGVENPLKNILSEFQFEEKTRERPLEFHFPLYIKSDVIINIPDGFEAEIPKDYKAHFMTDAKHLVYFQNAEIKENKIVLHIEFLIKNSTFVDQYQEIRTFFEKSNLAASKNILLKKI